jgi:site-specific DNA-methyltransferase (adenine-specific)
VKPYYEDDLVTLYHGDFREVPLDAPVDLIVADPPYGQTSLAWDRWVPRWPEYLAAHRSMWVFGTLRMFMEHSSEFSDWRMSQDIVWEKQNGSHLFNDRFRRVHEQAVHFYSGKWGDVYKSPRFTMDARSKTIRRKTKAPHLNQHEAVGYESVDGGPRLMRSVIQVRSTHGYAENETQKPVGILTPLIEYACPPGGVVFDPFMGSGSTLIAARDAGRRAIGIDIREDQCEIAARRCQWLRAEWQTVG